LDPEKGRSHTLRSEYPSEKEADKTLYSDLDQKEEAIKIPEVDPQKDVSQTPHPRHDLKKRAIDIVNSDRSNKTT
jgi:hypothetical protein